LNLERIDGLKPGCNGLVLKDFWWNLWNF